MSENMTSNLYAFLHPEKVVEQKEVIISERFKDQNGQVVPFILRPLDPKLNEALRKKHTKRVPVKGGKMEERFDRHRFMADMIVHSCIQPDFAKTELCEAYGTNDPLEVPSKMLTIGESNDLIDEIMLLNGIYKTEEEEIEEAKNS